MPSLCLPYAFLAAPAAAQESSEIHVARQPGLVYIQAIIMEEKKLIEKHAAALDEASEMVAKDTKAAAGIYLAVTKERITVDELIETIKQPGAIFSATPQRSMLWAEHMHRIGLIKQKPATWKDYSFPMIHDRNGS